MSIQIRNLYKSFHDNQVLRNVDLDVKEREIVVLMGFILTLKTTRLRCLCDLETADSGEILINDSYLLKEENGRSVYADKETKKALRKEVGMVFQNPDNQFIGATVADDIAFGLENHQVETEKMQPIIERFAQKVKMTEYMQSEPTKLSGGQKQRVAIAGVLAMSPQILIFDESTSMLDPQGKAEINELIQEIHKESNITIISITHDIEEVSKSDYVIVMDGGHVVMKGLPDDILRKEKELIALQLDIPFALKFTKAMRAHGVDMKDCTTMEKVVDEVCRLHFKK